MGLFTSGIFLATLAHAIIGISLVWDKILLRQPQTSDVVNYVFWLGAMSVLGLCLIPFGFHMPGPYVIALATGAGVVHLAANYFYYATLQAGEASQTLAIMGGFAPLATFLLGLKLLKRPLGGFSGSGFSLMVAGGFLMFFSERVDVRKILALTLLAASTFGLTNVMQKMAFDEANFVTAYVFFTMGTALGSLLLLVRPSWRQRIFQHSQEASPRSKFWYFVNRFISGVGSFLIYVAISRAHPAIVSAISGLRYIIIFAGTYLITAWRPSWLKEDFHGWALIAKTTATALIVAGLVLAGLHNESNSEASAVWRTLRRAAVSFSSPALLTILPGQVLLGQKTPRITTPKEALGFNIGDDYQLANYTQLEAYWKKLAAESDRMKLVDIGPTSEGRRQYVAIVTSPQNQQHLTAYKEISQKLAHAENLTDEQAHALAHQGKAVVWIDGGLHANETVGSQQEIEEVYEMVSRTDPEILRFLDDDILLCVLANPDGQELVANWYMREQDPLKRSLNALPRLFHHYIGHDNNRDFYISNMPETTNMNRQMFMEWFPQIVYNHHQTGPAGAVIFMPPFRDPFNYNLDPLIPLDVEAVGTAMHQRLVAEGKGGSVQRSGANYSTWWNGGLRTISYFHNMIGLLTEIIGNPTPMRIPLVPDKQLPSGDWPLPVAPQVWHYRQSIEYEMTNNRAVLDYASRNREVLLYNSYQMGKNSIRNGSEDHWTITPDRIDALKAAGGHAGSTLPAELYNTVLHDPKARDARGYIIPSDQPDFATATKFVNALLKTGITVMRASSQFQVNGKTYPEGSYVVKAAQAFRPHVMDMFEPQHHPNDFLYPGGPPVAPYDSAGWTLALQMGVQFDRILDGFDGPFTRINGLLNPPPGSVIGASSAAGYLISHRMNDSFVIVNRLLKASCDVYWLTKEEQVDGQGLGTGTIWVPACTAARSILERGAREFGVSAYGVDRVPSGEAWKLAPIRIGLYDRYGGLTSSGWDRWLFEQYEFPFEVVYPQTLDMADLRSRFDVLVFTDGAYRRSGTGTDTQPPPAEVPKEYRAWLGKITDEKTIPQIKRFIEAGGSVVTAGSSTAMAELLGVPVTSYLTEVGSDGKRSPLPREKYYIPASLLRMRINNNDPLAYGMPETVDVLFDNSPVFKLIPDALLKHTTPVAWFSGPKPLDSGWALGQEYLDGGTAIVEALLGGGKLFLLGPDVTFRGQSHGTFKLLFNGLYYGSAKPVSLRLAS
jgi:drug/metabolite transporter (DMT)-like permease